MANLNSSLLEGDTAASVNVAITSGAAGGHVDDSAFAAGTDDVSVSGGFFNDSTPDSVDEGDAGALRMSGNRVGYRTLRDAAGNERGANVTASNELNVIESSAAASLTALQLIDNPVAVLGTATYTETTTSGFVVGAVRNDVLDALAGTDNEIGPLQVNAIGALYTTGDVAHDAVDSGAPVKQGGKAVDYGTDPTEVAANDRTDLYANRAGIPFILGGHPNILSRWYRATTAQTNDAVIDSIGANDRIVVTAIDAIVSDSVATQIGIQIGFGTTSTPSEPSDGNSVLGMALVHPGVKAGSGVVRGSGAGIIAIGGKGEELRLTSGNPSPGTIHILVSYFIITEA